MAKYIIEKLVTASFEDEIRTLKKQLKAKDKEIKLLKRRLEDKKEKQPKNARKTPTKVDKVAELKEKLKKQFSKGKI